MPSAYSVPMASDVLPDPDTPTTATVCHSGTSTSMSFRLLCRAPRTPMTLGKVPGTGISSAAIPGNLRPGVSGCCARTTGRRLSSGCAEPFIASYGRLARRADRERPLLRQLRLGLCTVQVIRRTVDSTCAGLRRRLVDRVVSEFAGHHGRVIVVIDDLHGLNS